MSLPKRPDLQSLGPEELELFSNRGTVRRAGADLDDPGLTVLWETDDDGAFCATWSDGATVRFTARGTPGDARCTCPASASSTSLCRHVIRTVLALSKQAEAEAPPGTVDSWDPGVFADDDLAAVCSPANLARAKAMMEEGLLVEIIRQERPLVRIHGLGMTIRFLVYKDIRYARADAEGPAGQQAIAIAVLAARALSANVQSGWVQTGSKRRLFPASLFADTARSLSELFNWGISRVDASLLGELRILAERYGEAGLSWLADTLRALETQLGRYLARDALFSPDALVDALAELLARSDVLRSSRPALPAMLVGGTHFDRERDLVRLRLTGIGSSVELDSRGVTLTAWLLDEDTGLVLYLDKRFGNPTDGEAKDFHVLASFPCIPGIRFEDLASGRIIGSGGHASAAGKLSFGRKVSVSPQTFSWEKLRDGFLVEDFRELAAEGTDRAPAFLGSRRRGEGFVALKLASVEEVRFDNVRQEIRFIARDSHGSPVMVALPWISRGASGLEDILSRLGDPAWKPLFLSGSIGTTPLGLEIRLASLVFEVQGERIMLQPWIGTRSKAPAAPFRDDVPSGDPGAGAIKEILAVLQEAAGETLLIGESGHGRELAALWRTVARQAEARGSALLAGKAALLADAFEGGLHGLEKSGSEEAFFEMLVMLITGKQIG